MVTSTRLGSSSQLLVQCLLTIGALGSCYVFYKIVYNLYFHPLAKFPGPLLGKISDLWYAVHSTSGRWADDLEWLHETYGPVVRYCPNELDFATPSSYLEIHGHIRQGKQPWLKSLAYDTGPESHSSIVQARDHNKHREVRKMLAAAFSAKALRSQEEVVNQYIDLLVDQIKKRSIIGQPLNMHDWFNWVTFDIIGDLAFGESFGAVGSGRGHPWVELVLDSLHVGALFDVIRRIPILIPLAPFMVPKHLKAARKEHFDNALKKAQRRMERGNERDDFFSHLLRERENGPEITRDFICGQAETLIVAGSETSATFLMGAMYYLLKNPDTLRHLTIEIRSTFPDAKAINNDSVQGLHYLSAVIEEGLRIYPSVPTGIPRISPGAVVDGYYVPAGTTVSTSNWVNSHTEKSFKNAKEFHPERWLPETHPLYNSKYQNDVKEASRPFNIGPRACLGINLAYMEMRIILARLVWEFDWEMLDKTLDWEKENKLLVMWQKPPLWVKFTPVTSL